MKREGDLQEERGKEEGRVEEAVGLEQVGYHGKRAQGGATKA